MRLASVFLQSFQTDELKSPERIERTQETKYLQIISGEREPQVTIVNGSLATSVVTKRGAWGE